MAGMKNELTLIRLVPIPNDPYQRTTKVERTVFADRLPLHGGEFHAAGARGFELQHIMRVRASEYERESTVRLDGEEYTVYRTYPRSEDWVELYLSQKGSTSA